MKKKFVLPAVFALSMFLMFSCQGFAPGKLESFPTDANIVPQDEVQDVPDAEVPVVPTPKMSDLKAYDGYLPDFDWSSCWLGQGGSGQYPKGDLMCFPVDGTPLEYAAEWDLTKLCDLYPGTSICTKVLEVQKSLQ
jgi:hypothetical protein